VLKRSSFKRWIWGSLAGVWTGNVLVFSLIPVSAKVSVGNFDKALHLFQYMALAWLWVPAWHDPLRKTSRTLWHIGIAATLYGIVIEVIQGILPWRSGDWLDAAANAFGAAIGVLLWHKRLKSETNG